MTTSQSISRRTTLKLGVAGTAAAGLPLVHMRTAHAAGTLKLALWSHFVPAANPVMRKLVAEWGEKNHVETSIDFLSTSGSSNALLLGEAAEALGGAGHDVMAFQIWGVHQYHQHLEPVDDVVEGLIKQYGKLDGSIEYLGKVDGHWMAVPTSVGTQLKVACARMSLFEKWGEDVRKWYPNAPSTPSAGAPWTYERMLELAPKAKQANMPFALGLGHDFDSVDWTGALLRAYGAVLVDADKKILIRSDAVQQALEYLQKLYPSLPADAIVYTTASNNKALVAGKSAMIFNPPSGWWVARRDAPKIAPDCWSFPNPSGPKGRYIPYSPYFWGVWSFSQNKSAAKELISWLQQRKQVETLCDSSAGYDVPPFLSMHDFTIWATEKPPLGTIYNYPIRPWHDSAASIAASPAPPPIATQLYSNATFNVMATKLVRDKEKMKDVLDWAENEINGYINM